MITTTRLLICITGFLFIAQATTTTSLITHPPLTEEVLIIKSREEILHNNPTEIRGKKLLKFELDFDVAQIDVKICVQYIPFKIHDLYLKIIHFIKHISSSIDCLHYLHFNCICSLMDFRFKLEFVIRVITAPLWSSWLGYSALTREARVQFPVGE